MKKSFYLHTLLLLSPLLGAAQSQFDGVGKFRIGKTTTEVISQISEEIGGKVKPIDSFMKIGEQSTKSPKLFEVVANTKAKYLTPQQYSYCPDVKVYYLTTYDVAEVKFTNIYLTFKDNILISMDSNLPTDALQIFNMKYGKPELKEEEKIAKCVYKLTGATKSELKETHTTLMWNTGAVSLVGQIGSYYDSNCNSQFINNLHISDKLSEGSIKSCESASRDYEKANKEQTLKSKLSDF